MRNLLLPLGFLLLGACSPASTLPPCTRELVDRNGVINPFGRGIGGPDASVASPPLGMAGQPFTMKVFAPSTACEDDRLAARVELLSPANLPVSGATLSEPVRTNGNIVSVELTFTPERGGQHLVNLSFEPSLGVRSMLLDVAEERLTAPSVCVPIPNALGCVGGAWPVSGDTVACERDTKRVELSSADGGATSFAGEQLVVAGRALWSVNGTTSELERRVMEDGGLVLTNVFPGFSTRAVQGMHEEESALRALNSGALVIAFRDGGLLDLNRQSSSVTGQVLFADGPLLYTEAPCEYPGCRGLLGLEPGMRWSTPQFGPGLARSLRPIPVDGGLPEVIFERRPHLLPSPGRGFERLPAWLSVDDPELSVLVNGDRPSFGLAAWKRADVIRVGRDFVVLKDQTTDAVRLTPR